MPTPAPATQLHRVLVREGLWVAEVASDYDGQAIHYVSIVELKDGKMLRDARYYAEPFEAPERRALWVERINSYACDPCDFPRIQYRRRA